MVGQLDKIRSVLHNRLRTATLRNDFEGQVRIIQLTSFVCGLREIFSGPDTVIYGLILK